MEKMTRRTWLAAAGVTTAAAGTSGLLAQDEPLSKPKLKKRLRRKWCATIRFMASKLKRSIKPRKCKKRWMR